MKEMNKGEVITIAEREVSGMAGVSTEYLCLSLGQSKKYLLSIGGYEALAHISDYFNEETDDYEFPDAINGKKVHGFVDDYVVGGEIWLNINEDGIEFDLPTDSNVLIWLNKNCWQKLTYKSDLLPTPQIILETIEEILL